MQRIVLFNKPFDVLSQFSDRQGRTTLSDFINMPDVYPAGRLDRDSEGLLVLTNDNALKHKLTDPQHKVSKTYWVQVEGEPEEQDLQPLREGLELKDGLTRPAKAERIPPPHQLWPRTPPIRTRKHIRDSWISLSISEGRNRQVRRMCAAIGFPVLRLIRYRVGSWTIDGIANGHFTDLSG
ncbi:MAG: pseudouridine synthase [bacterium]